ncbi:hypothetical protein J6590_003444 [Homalodisca vitripennis]|nr:hypothetical protein J6590_003444 [Homalodisca vitripennis]
MGPFKLAYMDIHVCSRTSWTRPHRSLSERSAWNIRIPESGSRHKLITNSNIVLINPVIRHGINNMRSIPRPYARLQPPFTIYERSAAKNVPLPSHLRDTPINSVAGNNTVA